MAKIYQVGGCVRDRLLGLESKDIDFTFVLDDADLVYTKTVEEGFQIMTNWLTYRGFEIFLSTPEMYTIRARFPKQHKHAGLVADFVMARKEIGYEEGTRRPILILGSLEDDLIRRDFTLNALAEDEDGSIIDICGGLEDLKQGILRTPRSTYTTLLDDPLRLLRALRFSITKGFKISESIIDAISSDAGGEEADEIFEKLKKVVSRERVREELHKMMSHDTVKTMKLLFDIDHIHPGFIVDIVQDDMWFKPTFELKKRDH